MKIKQLAIDSIFPYDRNPRKNQNAIAKVAISIKEYGFRQPIVVDADMVVIAGHTRLEAAKSLGLKRIPVHIADGLTPEQVDAYRIADNRTADESEWDYELLAQALRELESQDYELTLTGFDVAQIADILNGQGSVDTTEEWQDMPEFAHEDKTAFKSIALHFKDQDAIDSFIELTDLPITEKTRYLWYPEIEITRMMNKEYGS